MKLHWTTKRLWTIQLDPLNARVLILTLPRLLDRPLSPNLHADDNTVESMVGWNAVPK